MAEGKIRVKFEAKDSDKLISAIKSLNVETKKLTGSSAKYENQTKKTDKANVNLRNNTKILGASFFGFGSILTQARAKLLLYAFAVQQASQLVNKLVRTSANIKDMSRAFNNLSDAAGFSSDIFDKLNEAVDGTVRKTNLMQQANNAMLLGIFESSDQMSEMFDVAQRLGQALGRTAEESIESLVTGLGRQSKLMLDNLGIVFDTNQAYEEHAKKLGKTTSALTDQEKKQAFVNKAVAIANDLVKQSGEEVLGTNAKLDQLSVSFENFQATIGDLVTPAVEMVSLALVKVFDNVSEVIDKFIEFNNQTEKTVTVGKTYVTELSNIEERVKNLNLTHTELTEILSGLSKENDLLNKSLTIGAKGLEQFKDVEITLPVLFAFQNALENTKKTIQDVSIFDLFSSDNTNQLSDYMIKLEMLAVHVHKASNEFKEYNHQLEMNKVKVSKVSEVTPKYTEFQRQLSASLGLLPEEIQNITTNAQLGAKAVGDISQAMVAMAKGNKHRIIQGLKLAKVAAIADSIAGASKSFAQGGFAGFVGGISMLASMMQRISIIDQQISQANSQKFEQGGLVGGRRHSQGGTMIEAERGEFVMSRNAVSAIGVENLNRMNQGQSSGGGSINININGGMISPDFVENELAESIREAVRRGADFGIS